MQIFCSNFVKVMSKMREINTQHGKKVIRLSDIMLILKLNLQELMEELDHENQEMGSEN